MYCCTGPSLKWGGGGGEFPKHSLVTSLGFYAALKSPFTKQHLPTLTSNIGVKMNKREPDYSVPNRST